MHISLKQWIDQNGGKLVHIKDSSKADYAIPKMVKKEDLWIWEKIKEEVPYRTTNPQYIAMAKDLICYCDGCVETRNNTIVSDFGNHVFDYLPTITGMANGLYVNLADCWSGINYWHWMATSLSKLYFIEKLGKPKDYHYIVNSLDNNFTKQSLMKFGIQPNQCVEIDDMNLFCKEIILVSKVKDGDIEPITYLRSKLRRESSGSLKIYISRSTTRRVINEDEILEELGQRGFIKVQCEKLSFDEQVNLFSNASVIIGPHGAGMANILFAKHNAKVLELRNKTYQGKCYLYLSSNLGFEYYNLYGVGHEISSLKEASSDLQADILIDRIDFRNTLDMMGV